MAKEMCEDCGKVFDGGPAAFFCPDCRKKRLSGAAKKRRLNKLGNDAYSRKQSNRNQKKEIESGGQNEETND